MFFADIPACKTYLHATITKVLIWYLLFSHSIHSDVQRNDTILFCGFDIFPLLKFKGAFTNNIENILLIIDYLPTPC